MIKNGMVDVQDILGICKHSDGMFFYREKQIGDRKVYIVNYRYQGFNSWNDYTREFRGLVFDEYGYILARPFPKFFNFGEKDCKATLDTEVLCNEKIDGSMVVFWKHFGLQASTRGTFDSDMIDYVNKHRSAFVEPICDELKGLTPIFEFTSPKFRIIIPYHEDKLTLVGIRNINDGTMFNPDEINRFAWLHMVPSAKVIMKGKIRDIVDKLKTLEGLEGWVGYMDDGDLVKLKTAWYFARHHLFDIDQAIQSSVSGVSKVVSDAFFNNTLDEILVIAQDDTKKGIDRQVSIIRAELRGFIDGVKSNLSEYFSMKNMSRKDFALRVKEKIPWEQQSIYFKILDGSNVEDAVYEFLKRQYGVKK